MILEEKYFNKIRDIFLTRRDEFGEIYVIGGYVRDRLLDKFNKDLDFAVKRNSLKAARGIADFFGGDCYALDKERETARALIPLEGQQLIVDIALINGENIYDDLKKRDFTINAMAVNLIEPDQIIDPLGGQRDLRIKKLTPCSGSSFSDDPVRTLRAVRFIQNLALDFDPTIKSAIISASKNLPQISAERIRDELCQILGLSNLDRSYKLMAEFEILVQVFPEIANINEIASKYPHVHDALTHSFRVVELIRFFLDCIFNSEKVSGNKFLSDVQLLIGNYKESLIEYSKKLKKLNFSIYSLMALAGLYHDSAKQNILPVKEKGKIIFPNHAEKSAESVQKRMRDLAFSNEEISFVGTIIKHHMSAHLKSIGEDKNPNRWVYRYFQDTKDLGVMIGFFHLADIIAAYEGTLPLFRWRSAINSVDKILDGWFNHFEDVVSPPRLITGDELIEELGMHPGRKIGQILEMVREEQAAGILSEKKLAIEYAKKINNELDRND